MKFVTNLIVVLVMGFVTAPVMASHSGEYTVEQLELTNTLFNLCPVEASQLLSQPHTHIVSGKFFNSMTAEGMVYSYAFNFTQRWPAPVFAAQSWTLNATKVVTERKNPPMDAAPYYEVVTCAVNAEEK